MALGARSENITLLGAMSSRQHVEEPARARAYLLSARILSIACLSINVTHTSEKEKSWHVKISMDDISKKIIIPCGEEIEHPLLTNARELAGVRGEGRAINEAHQRNHRRLGVIALIVAAGDGPLLSKHARPASNNAASARDARNAVKAST